MCVCVVCVCVCVVCVCVCCVCVCVVCVCVLCVCVCCVCVCCVCACVLCVCVLCVCVCVVCVLCALDVEMYVGCSSVFYRFAHFCAKPQNYMVISASFFYERKFVPKWFSRGFCWGVSVGSYGTFCFGTWR